MRNILWQSDAWDEYVEIQTDKALLRKVNRLLKDIMRNGYSASYGKVEMLKGNFSGFAGVRSGKKNRIIFQVNEANVIVLQCQDHYLDH